MKQSDPNVEIQAPGFLDYITTIFKKRIFALFMILGVCALLLSFFAAEFLLPSIFSTGIIFIGFVWRTFQVYQELSLAYQKAITPIPFQKNRRSGLTVSFVPGNEYVYSISDPYSGQDGHITRMQNTKGMDCRFDERGIFFVNGQVYYMMGKGGLEINFQILNSGDAPLDLVAIHIYDDLDLNHLRIYNDGVFLHGSRLRLPLQLAKGELVTLQSRHYISLTMGTTESLFAADFRALPRLIAHELAVEAVDATGNRQTFTGELKTLSKNLKDLYARQWREYGQEEYLVLAGAIVIGDG